jgi:putative ABC transport system ATP-binding protein
LFSDTNIHFYSQKQKTTPLYYAKNPKILLCDEPTGALDYLTGKNILGLLYDISKTNNKLVIVVTHNQALKEMADKVVKIKNGQIESITVNKNPKPISEIEW